MHTNLIHIFTRSFSGTTCKRTNRIGKNTNSSLVSRRTEGIGGRSPSSRWFSPARRKSRFWITPRSLCSLVFNAFNVSRMNRTFQTLPLKKSVGWSAKRNSYVHIKSIFAFRNFPIDFRDTCTKLLNKTLFHHTNRTEEHCVQTEVAPASQNPIWNANLSFPGVPGDELMERVLEITLWDLIPHNEHAFLGECSVDLQKAFLDDRAVWCRLEDPRQLRGKSPHTSPRSSIAGAGKRNDFGNQRSVSDDVDSIGECASLLHPDHAWGSRRGSSQSEQLEVEVYQLGKDFSRSLPGSRRSSFQSAQEQAEQEVPAAPPPPSYSRDRRRSSCTRMLRDPEEILKSLKAVKGELGRTMSLSAEKRHRSKFRLYFI